MDWASHAVDLLWRNAWGVIPFAVLVAVLCRCLPRRPATRHMLWLVVLLAFVAPLALPELPAGTLPDLESFRVETGRPDSGSIREDAKPVGSPSAQAQPEPQPVPDAAAARETHDRCPGLAARSQDLGESTTSPRAVALTEPRSLQRLPAAPGSVEPLFARDFDSASVADPAQSEGVHDEAVAPAPVKSPQRATPPDWWRVWLSGLLAARDATGRLPMVPLHIWVGGLGLLGLVQAGRVYGFRRRLRKAVPASRAVVRSVNQVSYAYGLRRAPETLMIDGCVSPMIWCGRKTRLILPLRLWTELDRVGRTAVICHELAHLRRRDHWVRWIELIVSALYWWHPVVWWARRRLHEESELCCDAWVTWLMPERRRVYAETLLRTKQFVGQRGGAVPTSGIGVTSVGARRFARRITMIMTGSTRPGASATGIVLASVLALLGWVTLPAWASPEDPDRAQSGKASGVEVITVPAPNISVWKSDGAATVAPKATVWTTSSGPAPLAFASVGDDDELQERLERLEHELQTLSKQLGELRALAGGKHRLLVVPKVPEPPEPPQPPEPAQPPIAFGGRGLGRFYSGGTDGETVAREYRLPEGKLKALTELMIRQDVPILVSPHDEYLEVHATARQHEIFAAFVEMIHPSAKKPRGAAGGIAVPHRIEAYTRALEPFGNSAKAYNDAYGVYNDALKKIEESKLSAGTQSRVTRALRQALRAQQRAGASAHAGNFAAMNELLESARAEARGHEEHVAAMEAEAQDLQQQSEELEAQAETLLNHAADLARSAEGFGDGDAARSLRKNAQEVQRRAKELESKARELERRAREMERKAERAGRDVEELDEGADELAAALDVLVAGAKEAEEVECVEPQPEPEPAR